MPIKPRSKSPPHYCRLSVRNFRGFRAVSDIRLAPLTFLVGPNSSGKSSLFDALLLVTQSDFSPWGSSVQTPNWGGPLVDLGSFEDTVYKHNAHLAIQIEIEISPSFCPEDKYFLSHTPDQPMTLTFELEARNDDPIGKLAMIRIVDNLSGEYVTFRYASKHVTMQLLGTERQWSAKRTRRDDEILPWIRKEIDSTLKRQSLRLQGRRAAWRRIRQMTSFFGFWSMVSESQRVSSGRAAPKRWYSVTDSRWEEPEYFGLRVFDTVDPSVLDVGRSEDRFHSPTRRRPNKKRSLDSVLNELDIATKIHDKKLSPYHTGISVRDKITKVTSNLIDVGYGASQVIPVLNACLSDASGPLFVEQPEIHLHPKAQGTVADLLCETSKNRQVVVETHSVHMINRARIFVARGKLPAEHVMVNYVERTPSGSRVVPIPVLPSGDFGADWPEGFFDERYDDTMLLLKLKSER